MQQVDFKKFLPHIVAILLFAIVSMVYFSPVVSGKKKMRQSDISFHKGMSKEIADFREKYKEEPLWTNGMFCGMPSYQISTVYKGNLMRHVDSLLRLWLPHPIGLIFLYMIGFYILLMSLRIDPWLSVLGSIGFGFSSYFFVILEAGHNSKAHAIGYMAPVLAGFLMAYRGNYLWGGIITAIFLSLEILANHLQITYYLFLLLMIFVFAELVKAIREKQIASFTKASAVLLIASAFAVISNFNNLWATYNYLKFTTRGKSELTINEGTKAGKSDKTTGLDKSYIFHWSYGKAETMSLLIPNFKGGGDRALKENRDALKSVDPQFAEYVGEANQYWGDQPGTSGPVYAGAIIVFLAVLGLFLVEGTMKWALIGGTLLSMFLAWGKNFEGFNNFMVDYFPGYNKFRAVSMTLVLAELTIPLLAVLGIDRLLRNTNLQEKINLPLLKMQLPKQTILIVAFALTAGVAGLFFVVPKLNTFYGEGEYQRIYDSVKQQTDATTAQRFLENIETARIAVFKSDVGKTILYITLAFAAIFIYFRTKFDRRLLLGILMVIVLIDMWSVNRRYVNEKDFVSKEEVEVPFQKSAADERILADPDPDYRVLNLAVDFMQDASTSYFHKSIGGYHAAKLKRYQELYDFQLSKDVQRIYDLLKNPVYSDSLARAVFAQNSTLNMLNTKYIIYNPEKGGLAKNESALGCAWPVAEIKWVANADSEITALSNFNPAKTVIIDKRYKSILNDFSPQFDPAASIRMVSYKTNDLLYDFSAQSDQLVVFSEIYYPEGWNAYVDGKLIPHFGVNYVLRGMKIPGGKHKIEFKFEPTIYATGEKISYAGSSVILLILLFAGFREFRKIPELSKKV